MKIWTAFLTLPWLAYAAPMSDSGSLSSTDASYDGSSLNLTGHVVLDHGLGKMTAEEASLQRQEVGKEFPFSFIQLRKDVVLALKNSAQITCGSAELDFNALKGTLLPEEKSRVVYTDQIKKKKGGDLTPLSLSGLLVELHFAKQIIDEKKTDYEIDNILAKEEVLILYDGQFELSAHHALYRKELSRDNKSSKREFQGVLTAYPKDELSQCVLRRDTDEIFADMVDIDMINAKLSLLHPKGTLYEKTHFQSDYLYWDQGKNFLTLKGNVSVDDPTFGTLQAQDELQLAQVVVKGKPQLKAFHSQGTTSLLYKDASQAVHKLISHGTIHFDKDKLHANLDSPEVDGSTPRDKQLYYQEEEIAIYADSAALEYSLSGDTLEPTLLTLKGNIRLFSHDSQKPPRCGCADRLTYSLTTRTLILSANAGKKVLFWDETQGMHLSAPEVHITRDQETKLQHIKGVGAVQFSFTPEEQSKFQQLFPQLKKQP